MEERALPVKNQAPSNERSGTLFSGSCNGKYRRATTLFAEQASDMTPLQEPPKYSLRSSTDEFVRASTLFPEFGSCQTLLQECPKTLSSESPNNQCIRATSLFEKFDVQTPSQDPSKRIFLGSSHGSDTPLTEYGSDQTLLQHPLKKFSLVSSNGEYVRAAGPFGLDSTDTPTQEPSKKLEKPFSGSPDPSYIKATNLFAEFDSNGTPLQNHSKKFSSEFMNGKRTGAAATLFSELDSSPLRPETPAMRAVVPRLKRVQEDECVIANNQHSPLWGSNKKVKSAHCSPIKKQVHDEMAESARSKFEWLNPCNIRDANGKRPKDPLFDNRTLYIPPDALRKMSTSQKQYWNIKCKYMDVVLFFKVVSLITDLYTAYRAVYCKIIT